MGGLSTGASARAKSRHATAVHGVEVFTIGTDEWVQVASDDARAWRRKEQEGLGVTESRGKRRGTRRARTGKPKKWSATTHCGVLDEPARARERQAACHKQPFLRERKFSHDQSPFLRPAGRRFSTAAL